MNASHRVTVRRHHYRTTILVGFNIHPLQIVAVIVRRRERYQGEQMIYSHDGMHRIVNGHRVPFRPQTGGSSAPPEWQGRDLL